MAEDELSDDRIRTALFVDFDNIYSGLRRQDRTHAETFGNNPEHWLTWLEANTGAGGDGGAIGRKILIRKCYLNPQEYWNYRPYFIRSAFEVTDCPPLTAQGKTSTDIHLVMDVLDALNHPVRFDEFVIFSGDADFTPVLLRLRMNDRLTTMLSAGYTSPAYKASCDLIIPIEEFVRDALGIAPHEEEEPPISSGEISEKTKALLQKMADRLYEEASEPSGIQANDLPAFYAQFDEFAESEHWLGFNSIRNLTEAVVARREDLIFLEKDPWRVARGDPGKEVPEELEVAADACESDPDIHSAIISCITKIVARSPDPVKMEYLANILQERFAEPIADTKWLGAFTFKNLLKKADLKGLKVSPVDQGYVYDPLRHQQPVQDPLKDNSFYLKYPEIEPLAKKINKLTDTPILLPEQYRLLFDEIVRAVKETGFYVTGTSEIVSNRCIEKGAPVSKEHVVFVIGNLKSSNYPYERGRESAEKMSKAFAQLVIRLCRSVQFVLKMEEQELVWAWITGSDSLQGSAKEDTEKNQSERLS